MSKLSSNIPKHRRVLVKIIKDGSAKTFVYRDLDEERKTFPRNLFGRWVQKRKLDGRQTRLR